MAAPPVSSEIARAGLGKAAAEVLGYSVGEITEVRT
jgi:hypothetical protein